MKRESTSNLALDTAHYTPEIVQMMDEAEHCLNCGVGLKYIQGKDKRRNRGYCSLRCYYNKPPKLAYAEREWGMPARDLIIHLLNRYTVQVVADMLGVGKPQVYEYMKKFNVTKIVIYK